MSIGGVGLVYVYDAKLWGGSLASSISAGYAKDCYGLSSAPSKTCSSSLTDVYSDLIEWSYFFADERSTNEQAGLRPIPYGLAVLVRSEEHTSELQSLMRPPFAVFCLK